MAEIVLAEPDRIQRTTKTMPLRPKIRRPRIHRPGLKALVIRVLHRRLQLRTICADEAQDPTPRESALVFALHVAVRGEGQGGQRWELHVHRARGHEQAEMVFEREEVGDHA